MRKVAKQKMTAMVMAVCTVLLGSGVAVYAQKQRGFNPHLLYLISRSIRRLDSSSVVQQGSSFVATYKADVPSTPNGKDVTNVMIFEEDSEGQVRVVAFPNSLAPGGVSVLNDTLNFAPTSMFIVGLNLPQPSDLKGKNHVVMFVNDAFASSAHGEEFSQAFVPLHEQAFIKTILLAYGGDTSAMNLLKSDFANGPLHKAAFTPGGKFTVVNSSVIGSPPPPVPEIDPATGAAALALVAGAVLLIRGRRKK
jgi:hypothetical protein